MTPAFITQWLEQPGTDIDAAGLEALTKAYPYFVPARYLEAAVQHRKQPFSPPMLSSMQLYRGNWLQFCQLMEQATRVVATEQDALPLTLPGAEERPEPPAPGSETESLIQPVFTEDYFRHQGLVVEDSIPEELDHTDQEDADASVEDPRSLLVVMSFSEWLLHFRTKSKKEKEEEEDRRALKTMWQKEKLAAALEEENDEIPENVFEMAVNSITKEDDLASESLAEIMVRQGKIDKAIEMYKKLSLRNPQKSAYFAQQIAQLQKNF